ncbi:solute carrier family 23 protein [Streptomyces sp. NPDC059122]|uniref:solute carrier family 23 protein n=1 Tax=Streptomyces sp. NPDC059122 TaxID=3346732 RepID=UPI0036A72578
MPLKPRHIPLRRPRPVRADGERHPTAGRTVGLGVQHALVMYAGAIAVPLMFGAGAGLTGPAVGALVNADVFVAGLVTVVQSLGAGRFLGVRLPLVTGGSFVCVTPMIMTAREYGLPAVYGSMIAGPDPAAADYAPPAHLALAGGVIGFMLLLRRFLRGFLAQVSVLLALLAGTLAALPMGLTDFSGVADADWLGLVTPFRFGAPTFPLAGVVSMCVVMLVVFAESTAQMIAVGEAVERPLTDRALGRGLAADGLSGVLGGAMNSFPDTVFAGNIGLTLMTGIRSRYVTAAGGVVMVCLGTLPKLGELIASLPHPVVGGASLMCFATVAAVGIDILRRARLDRGDNLLIAAAAIGTGMLPVVAPRIYHRFPEWWQLVFGSPSTAALVVALGLHFVFHHGRRRAEGASAAG